jgi:hypothetical protein
VNRLTSVLAALCCVVGALCAVTGTGTAIADTPALGAITVAGPHLLKDGAPWIPRGVQIVGLVAPDDFLFGKYIPARGHYSASELALAKADGADLIRFQVSQFALDPLGTYYSPMYLHEVIGAVRSARALGLSVIISVQAELPTGVGDRCPLPDGQTDRVWQEFAPLFAGDPGVMFELYNEPGINPSTAAWQTWLDGGPVVEPDGIACLAVGVQQLIDDIRSAGAGNVIIVPGLAFETTLAGLPPPTDPANPSNPQLAYGVHYPQPSGGIPVWDLTFGRFAARAPVIVTEWDENSTTACFPNAPNQTALLLDYLAVKQIGVVGFAFDLPGTIVSDYSTYAPTSYATFACGVPGGGPGRLLFGEFQAMAQASSATRPGVMPAWVISSGALAQLEATDPATTAHFFNTPRTFVTGASAASLAALSTPSAIPTATFTNEAALASAVGSGALAPGTRAVVLDLEHWSRTPLSQQRQPGVYIRLAAQLAHEYGVLLVADPATNLALARSPDTRPSQQYAQFIKQRIAANAARYADVLELDARGSDTSGSDYAAFVQAASSQALGTAPDVTLLASLSSGPPKPALRSPGNLLDAALATRWLVSGYQLNDFRRAACNRCSMSPAALAGAFLRQYMSVGG